MQKENIDSMKKKKQPKTGTWRWREDQSWLEYGKEMKMICKVRADKKER